MKVIVVLPIRIVPVLSVVSVLVKILPEQIAQLPAKEKYVQEGYRSPHCHDERNGTGLTNFNWANDLKKMQKAIDWYNMVRLSDDPVYWISDKCMINKHHYQDDLYGSLHVQYYTEVHDSSKFWAIHRDIEKLYR